MATQLKEPETELDPNVNDNGEGGGDGGSSGRTDGRDYEAEARRLGWKPETEFADGERRPATFKDAETFVREGEEKAGLNKKTVDQLKQQLKTMERTVRRLTAAEQQAFTRGIESAKAQLRAAAESGDMQAFDAAQADIDALNAAAPKEDLTHGENPNVEFINFRDEHAWYDRGGLASATAAERDARALADRTAERLAAEGLMKNLAPSAFFARIADEVTTRYPQITSEKPAPRQKPASDVHGGSRPGLTKTNTAANLPAEAVAQADRFFEDGIIKAKTKAEAREKFARDYFGQ